MMATTIMPMNTSVTPSRERAASTAPTRNSESQATSTVATNRTNKDLPSDHSGCRVFDSEAPSCASPANSWRWVTSEKISKLSYVHDSTTAIASESLCSSSGLQPSGCVAEV